MYITVEGMILGEMTALTLMDLATLASAAGTLGLAFTSWYQMRRSRRDSLHPLVYAESAWVDTDEVNNTTGAANIVTTEGSPNQSRCQTLNSVRINLKNYGTGPALDLQFVVRGTVGEREPSDVQSDVQSAMHSVPIHAILKAGQAVPYMNLAPNQEVSVELALEASDIGPRADGPLVIEVHYRSVFRQHLHRAFTIKCLGGLASITNVAGTK